MNMYSTPPSIGATAPAIPCKNLEELMIKGNLPGDDLDRGQGDPPAYDNIGDASNNDRVPKYDNNDGMNTVEPLESVE